MLVSGLRASANIMTYSRAQVKYLVPYVINGTNTMYIVLALWSMLYHHSKVVQLTPNEPPS